jgi:hypothetical protein
MKKSKCILNYTLVLVAVMISVMCINDESSETVPALNDFEFTGIIDGNYTINGSNEDLKVMSE